jgi:signal transduction histidine kinase
MVVGDAVRLRQLVRILVDNAIRHSPAGGEVVIRVRPNGGSASLEIADQGPGVAPEDMARIFERFWRAPGAPSGGTGLGLAIAKWIVDAHRGQLECKTSAGQGTEMLVRLPAPDYSSSSSLVTNVSSSVLTARTVSGWLRSTPARARRFIG